MNLPNKLTMLRVALIPVFLVLFCVRSIPNNYLWALVVFAAASVTDCLDGQIARRRGLVTDFGKFMDPLADKVLVMTAIICFVEAGMVPAWVAAVILARELAVTGLRTLAASGGIVIAADKWGKIKTVSQMIWLIYGLLVMWLVYDLALWELSFDSMVPLYVFGPFYLLMAVVVVTTIGSGANYIIKNKALFADR